MPVTMGVLVGPHGTMRVRRLRDPETGYLWIRVEDHLGNAVLLSREQCRDLGDLVNRSDWATMGREELT